MKNNNEYHNIDALFSSHFEAKEVKLENKDAFWNELQSNMKEDKWRTWMFIIPLLGVLSFFGSFQNDISTANGEIPATPQSTNSFTAAEVIDSKESITLAEEVKEEANTNVAAPVAEKVAQEQTNLQRENATPVALAQDRKTVEVVKEPSDVYVSETSVIDAALLSNDAELITAQYDNASINVEILNNTEVLIAEEEDNIGLSIRKPNWSKCEVKAKGNWYVDVYGQGVRVLENLESNPDNQPYLNEYDQKFDPANGMMAGAMIGYKFPIGLMISGGLEYQRYQNKYESITRVVTTERIYDPMAYFIIDDMGNRVYVGDTVSVTTIKDREETIANNTQLINIPIHVGFQKRQNDWCYGADIGAIINISKQYEGVHLLADGSVIALDKDNFDRYMTTSTGLSFSLGVSIGRMVSDNMELYLSPRFRYNNKNNFKEEVGLSLENNFAGLRAGMRYYFD